MTTDKDTPAAGLNQRDRVALRLAKECFASLPEGESPNLADVIAVALGAYDAALSQPVAERGERDADTAEGPPMTSTTDTPPATPVKGGE